MSKLSLFLFLFLPLIFIVLIACGHRSDSESVPSPLPKIPAPLTSDESKASVDESKPEAVTPVVVDPVPPAGPVIVDPAAPTFEAVFTQVLKPNCVGRHSTRRATAGVNLETYAGAKAKIERINVRAIVEQTMPPSGPLEAEDITLLKAWIDAEGPE